MPHTYKYLFSRSADTNENSVPIECASTLLSDYKKMVYTNFPNYTKEPNDSYFDLKEVSRPDLISVGELPLDTQNELKITLINFLNKCTVPFTIDVTSQIKYDLLGAPYAIPSIDHPEVKEWLSLQEIKTVWHFGERLTSKRYYQLLKEKNVKIINFSNSRLNFNPSLCRKEQIPLNSEIINSFQEIQFKRKNLPDFSSLIELKRSIIEDNPLSFPYISKKIIEEHVSSDDLLVLANSTCIRSFDFFASKTKNASTNIYCHRGASGIEGYFASLIGINDSKKIKSHGKIVAILGDITALHDFNSLLLMQEIVPQVRIDIFIINDSGGGIFRLLNVPELLRCKQEMETPHKTNFFKVLRTIFENNKYINIQQINCKRELLKLLNKEQDQQKQCMNFYEIVLDQEEKQKGLPVPQNNINGQQELGYIKSWLLAIRPKTLTASLSPVLLTFAFISHVESAIPSVTVFFTTIFCALLMQIGTNLVNDYFDGIQGIDTISRLGPTRVVAAGIIPPEEFDLPIKSVF